MLAKDLVAKLNKKGGILVRLGTADDPEASELIIHFDEKSKRTRRNTPGIDGIQTKPDATGVKYDDVGPEVTQFIYTSMLIDTEWSMQTPRGFTWWGHGLAQRIWADECRRDMGVDVTLMHSETDFLRNVDDNRQTLEGLNFLNTETSQFAFIYRPEERRIRLHSTVYTHRQNVEWSKRLLQRAVGLQVATAHTIVDSSSHLFKGSEPDATCHPKSGYRQKSDEMVHLLDNFFIPQSEIAPPIDSSTFELTKEHLQPQFMVTSGDKWLNVEFPFSGDEPASIQLTQGKLGLVTSLLTVNSYEGHPLLGRGLMMRMALPVLYGREEGLQIATILNLKEATEWPKCHLNGAWCIDDKSQLLFISFYPIAAYKPWELINLALSFSIRSQWAGGLLTRHD